MSKIYIFSDNTPVPEEVANIAGLVAKSNGSVCMVTKNRYGQVGEFDWSDIAGMLSQNDPDQPGTASDKPLQTAMPRDSAASLCSPPCRNVINDDSEKASELVVIPDDITGSVTVDCLGQAFKYNFESGSLVSIFSEYGPKTTT